jgi:hypothetical protein
MGKDIRLHFRLDPAARERLRKVCELTGLDEPTAMRACIQAFIEHVEEKGGIWLPLAIVPKDSTPPKAHAAKPPAARTRAGIGSPSASTHLLKPKRTP